MCWSLHTMWLQTLRKLQMPYILNMHVYQINTYQKNTYLIRKRIYAQAYSDQFHILKITEASKMLHFHPTSFKGFCIKRTQFVRIYLECCLLLLLCVAYITKICSLSRETRKLRDKWKEAKVTLFYKGGEKDKYSNHRPTPVLPPLSVILQKHVWIHLYQFWRNI